MTGSTIGIGLPLRKALANKGCNLMIRGFAPAGAPERLCEEIGIACGAISVADLCKREEARKMVADATDGQESSDILVNEAGLQLVGPITEFADEKWDYLTAVFVVLFAIYPSAVELFREINIPKLSRICPVTFYKPKFF